MTDEDLFRERLLLAMEAAGLDLWENNLTTGEVTQRVTQVFTELGYTHQDLLISMGDLFALVHPDDADAVQAAIDAHVAGETEQYRSEFRLRARDGSWVWYANYGRIMDVADGRFGKRFIGVTFNIDDRKRREEEIERLNRQLAEQNVELQRLATTDALTEVANRRLFIETGAKEWRRAMRHDQPLSLLILDIDHFKSVNDSWGHPGGDLVLRSIAGLCRLSFRHGVDLVARIGGEEFAVLMPATSSDDALSVAERLCREIAAHQIEIEPGIMVSCTVSIGVATFAGPQANEGGFVDLLATADRALYRAKSLGRNRLVGDVGKRDVDKKI